MTTMADWVRDVVAAAEKRGWAVTLIDARASLVVLEEPIGHGGMVLRVSGSTLSGDFVRTLPEARGAVEDMTRGGISRGTP
jgi:hypothetical protein